MGQTLFRTTILHGFTLLCCSCNLFAQQYCFSGTVTTVSGNSFNVGDTVAVTASIQADTLSCNTFSPVSGLTENICNAKFNLDITSGGRHWTSTVSGAAPGYFMASGLSAPLIMVASSGFQFLGAGEFISSPSTSGTALGVDFELSYPADLVIGNILPATLPSPAEVQSASGSTTFQVNDSTGFYYLSYSGQNCALPPITILDPVPTLLNGPAITSNRSTLASGSTTVVGVAADGITQVIFKAAAFAANDAISATIFSACTDPTNVATCTLSSSSDENGGFFPLGTQVTQASQLANTSADVADPTTVATFFAYRAPIDFVRPSASQSDSSLPSRTVFIRFSYPYGGQTYGSQLIPLTIVRPPVVLIHGIWSSRDTWNYFTPLVTSATAYDSRFNVYRADYSELASDHVSQIEQSSVFDQVVEDLLDFKLNNSVAAVQTDIIAHSLGGLVSRDMVTDIRFFASRNFERGYIHKLITIATPHNGTPIATNLLASSTLCQEALGAFGHTVSGAVEDLALNNPLLTLLNSPQPLKINAHAIVGIANSNQELASEVAFQSITWGVSAGLQTNVCIGILPLGGYQELFNGNSDLLVPQASQSFGFAGSSVDTYVDFIHTVAPALYPLGPDELNRVLTVSQSTAVNPGSPTIPARAIQLLNTPISQNSFVMIEP